MEGRLRRPLGEAALDNGAIAAAATAPRPAKMELSVPTPAQPRAPHQQAPTTGGGGGGPCAEMLQVAEEAFRGGQFSLAAEILSSQLAELPQPERGLCLRRGDALARAGRMAEALESYSAAARLARLRPEELRELAESFALVLRDKELRLPPWGPGPPPAGTDPLRDPPCCCRPPEPLACPVCLRLLCEPVTLHCGHTHCRRCCCTPAGGGGGDSCARCAARRPAAAPAPALASPLGLQQQQPAASLRVNVVLGSLLEKWFPAESRARRLCSQGDALRDRQELAAALDKYNQALELGECPRWVGG